MAATIITVRTRRWVRCRRRSGPRSATVSWVAVTSSCSGGRPGPSRGGGSVPPPRTRLGQVQCDPL